MERYSKSLVFAISKPGFFCVYGIAFPEVSFFEHTSPMGRNIMER